ncbi:MAG TPA: hypothetical protein VIY08_16530 [Candidatus Nitrosocosmicus sp.]
MDIPKIIEKYITAISIEDKIKEESQNLDRLKMQTIQANNTAKALSFLKIAKVNHVSIWKWIQKVKSRKFSSKTIIKELYN